MIVLLELTHKSVSEEDICDAYEKRRDTAKPKKSAFQILKKAVNVRPKKERRKSVDAGQLLRWGFDPDKENKPKRDGPRTGKCYVQFSDGRNLSVNLADDRSVQDVLNSLVQRLDIDKNHVDWMLIGESRENRLLMDQNSMELENCHLRAELRCSFKLDLIDLKKRIAIRYIEIKIMQKKITF